METNCGTTVEEPLEHILTADGKPLSMFVPDNYEPGYPYPLVIWLHGAGGSDQEIERIMPQISDRNMFGIALRGNRRSITAPQGQNSWSNDPAEVAALADTLYETVCNVRRLFHIHSERIFLAGCDQGATLATRLLLEYPDWFAGLLSIGGEIPAISNPLARFRQLQGKTRSGWLLPGTSQPTREDDVVGSHTEFGRHAGHHSPMCRCPFRIHDTIA